MWILGVLVGMPVALAAQERSLLPLGVRIRVTTATPDTTARARGPTRTRFVGTLADLRADAVVLDVDPHDRRVVPFGTLRELEVSRGRQSRTGRGALIGLAAGAAAGVTTVLALCAGGECESSGGNFTGFGALVVGAAGALAGTGIGALVGALIRTERWEGVSLDGVRLYGGPAGRAGLALSWWLP
ncbi:MAG: hypothetical protein OER21_12335 [Gemmatimonadota bacterium]|nr:hypothetical protein [Gemmatimonadota bacterium]